MNRKLFKFIFLGLFLVACEKERKSEDYNKSASDPELFHECSDALTNVMIHDIFKPPVASRIYVYTYLASYETIRNQYPEYQSFAGKINGLGEVPKPEKGKEYCFGLASVKAMVKVGKTLTFSADIWEKFELGFFKKYEEMGIPKDVYERSVKYGEQVAKHILEYASKDNYKQTRGFRYTVTRELGKWEPTPPTYADACEPRWNTIRPFTLDSVTQYIPPRPVPFSSDKKSDFFKLAKEVYDLDKNLTNEQKDIAYFWDDNPFVTNIIGHVSFADKKMTPPGHWIAIVRTITKQKKSNIMEVAQAYAITSVALFDAFIVSWDEKYRSVRIRPVTVINNYIDPNWMPFLETPGFPEYVSGHSAISAAAGKVLIHLYGDISFTDSTEYKFKHGVRSFNSITTAYNETSISRVYGGIHYRDGVEEGTKQGEKVGEWVWKKLEPKK